MRRDTDGLGSGFRLTEIDVSRKRAAAYCIEQERLTLQLDIHVTGRCVGEFKTGRHVVELDGDAHGADWTGREKERCGADEGRKGQRAGFQREIVEDGSLQALHS